MSTLTYEPLDTTKKEFRLIRLEITCDSDSPIRCEIAKYTLDNCPVYRTLSYVWGDPLVTEDIFVDGQRFPATSNLVAFLYTYRALCYELLWEQAGRNESDGLMELGNLWIDAICINQADDRERAQQVLLMGRIYSQTFWNLAWLGEETDNTKYAFQAFEYFRQLRDELEAAKTDWHQIPWSSLPEQLIRCDRDSSRGPILHFNNVWLSIEQLFERSYWTRVWTFQEAVVPYQTMLICGHQLCPLDFAMDLAVWMFNSMKDNCPSNIDELVWVGIKSLTRIGLGRIRPISVAHHMLHTPRIKQQALQDPLSSHCNQNWHVIVTVSRLEASRAHDEIYGSLGLSRLPIIPDYALAIEQVYYEVARLGILGGFVDSVLSLAVHGGSNEKGLLRSWVPHWPSINAWSYGLQDHHVANAGRQNALKPMVNDLGQLLLSGKIQDTVQHVGSLFDSMQYADKAVEIIMHFVSAEYINGMSLEEAIWRTLLCDHDVLGGTGRFHPNSSQDMWKRNRDMLGTGCFVGTSMRRDPNLAAWLADSQDTRLFKTEQGYLGMANPETKPGDLVAVTEQCRLPLILRKRGSNYISTGSCFVLGLMDGEAFENDPKIETFRIV